MPYRCSSRGDGRHQGSNVWDGSIPVEILRLVMEHLAPDEQCRMSLANKALRHHFVNSGLKAAVDRALYFRDAGNGALISDTWQWGIAVRRERSKDSFRRDFEKLCGQHTSYVAFKSAYRFHLVMAERVQCAPGRRWNTHLFSHIYTRSAGNATAYTEEYIEY